MRTLAAIGAAAGLCGVASANQMLWTWDVEYTDPAGEINSIEDSVTALLSAQFNSGLQFAGADFEISSNGLSSGDFIGVGNFLNGSGGNPGLNIGMPPGLLQDDDFMSIAASQGPVINDPNASASNPIPVFRITWQTDDLTPREIDVATANHEQSTVYTEFASGETMELPSVPDSFTINVVPAPASSAALALGGIVALRRRR